MPNNLFKFKNGKFVMTEGYGSEITSENNPDIISESRKKVKKEAARGTQHGAPTHDTDPFADNPNNINLSPRRGGDIGYSSSLSDDPYRPTHTSSREKITYIPGEMTDDEILSRFAPKNPRQRQQPEAGETRPANLGQSQDGDGDVRQPNFIQPPKGDSGGVRQAFAEQPPSSATGTQYSSETSPIMYHLTGKYMIPPDHAEVIMNAIYEWSKKNLEQAFNIAQELQGSVKESKYVKTKNPSKIIKHPSLVGVRKF